MPPIFNTNIIILPKSKYSELFISLSILFQNVALGVSPKVIKNQLLSSQDPFIQLYQNI